MEERPAAGRAGEAAREEQTQAQQEALRNELAEARREAAENHDRYLRALAEKENARKRLERLYDERLAEAKRELLRRVIGVSDNLERALAHQAAHEAFVEGVVLTHRQLQSLLRSEGVEPIQALGQPFDPREHEAVELVQSPEPPGTIVAEDLRGYKQGDCLLRPARVRVVAGRPD